MKTNIFTCRIVQFTTVSSMYISTWAFFSWPRSTRSCHDISITTVSWFAIPVTIFPFTTMVFAIEEPRWTAGIVNIFTTLNHICMSQAFSCGTYYSPPSWTTIFVNNFIIKAVNNFTIWTCSSAAILWTMISIY